MVGVVSVPDLELEVKPKANFGSLLFMLGFANDPSLRPEDVPAACDDNTWAIVAEWYARLVERALQAGVRQGYRSVNDALPLVRGRIDFGRQLAVRPHALIPLEVEYDDFSADIYENRLLLTALVRAAWLPRLSPDLRARLRHLQARLQGTNTLPRHRLGDWTLTRANARYAPALRFADLLLQGMGLDAPMGSTQSFGFVVDMARVFEDFLVASVAAACLRRDHVRAEHHTVHHLDERRRISIAPDIEIRGPSGIRAVLDAKYKLGGAEGYPVDDLYQMLAYCTVTGVDRGWLVYAGSRRDGAEPVDHLVKGSFVTLTQWPLDVSVGPAKLIEQVSDLVDFALRGGPRASNAPTR